MQYFLDYLNTINSYKEHHEIAEGIVAEDGHQKPDLALLGNYYFFVCRKERKGEKRTFYLLSGCLSHLPKPSPSSTLASPRPPRMFLTIPPKPRASN